MNSVEIEINMNFLIFTIQYLLLHEERYHHLQQEADMIMTMDNRITKRYTISFLYNFHMPLSFNSKVDERKANRSSESFLSYFLIIL